MSDITEGSLLWEPSDEAMLSQELVADGYRDT